MESLTKQKFSQAQEKQYIFCLIRLILSFVSIVSARKMVQYSNMFSYTKGHGDVRIGTTRDFFIGSEDKKI